MMGDDGYALRKSEAMEYARINDLVFIEGKDIVEIWKAGHMAHRRDG
jgi:3,4-dihydroxy-2-butanone 4-phosphate synthase